jgi:hypothetical protein
MMFSTGGLMLVLLTGMSGVADARGQVAIRIDKGGVQFGAALDPRQHGYEHAYRDGATAVASTSSTGFATT